MLLEKKLFNIKHNKPTNRLNEPSRKPHHSSVTPNNKYDKSDIIHITTTENKGKSKDLHRYNIMSKQ